MFTWEEHIRLTGQKAAPASYFRQALEPPANTFEKGMKLEARDPRSPSDICLATVIDKCATRILLRLDGSDKCNDFWRLVDDQDSIAPLGTNYMLVPPVGSQRTECRYRHMVEEARAAKATHAPATCFHTAPAKLIKNEFQIGTLLEAVDKKSPFIIAPAVVTESSREAGTITVQFLGWKDVGMFNCSVNSRDIFPVGWCEQVGHPLEVPGPHYSTTATAVAPARTSLTHQRVASQLLNDSPTRRERPPPNDRQQHSPTSSNASSSKRERPGRRRERDADSDEDPARTETLNSSPKAARLSEVRQIVDADSDGKARTAKADAKKQETVIPAEKKATQTQNFTKPEKKTTEKVEIGRADKPKERVWLDDDQVEAILGANMVDGELQFLFKWRQDDVAEMVPSSVANRRYPLHVIKFYEDRLVWCRPEADDGAPQSHAHSNNRAASTATAN